jgi:hypothetical protein
VDGHLAFPGLIVFGGLIAAVIVRLNTKLCCRRLPEAGLGFEGQAEGYGEEVVAAADGGLREFFGDDCLDGGDAA